MSRLLSVAILLFIVFFIVRLVKKIAPELPDEEDDEDEIDVHQRALHLLLDDGYQIVSMREEIPCGMQVDDESWKADLVADFTVRRDGQTYVVKMREDGAEAPEDAAELRRELLPYFLLYRPAAVLYMDLEDETIQVIHFDIQERRT
ncbi:MAG: hypothetical protein WCC10_03435 [Tumebacillaceae bacterium]